MDGMNKLPTAKRVQVLSGLVEGCSMASVTRMFDVDKHTIGKLLADVGEVCSTYQDRVFRNLKCHRLECDELHSFIQIREVHVPEEKKGKVLGYGEVWTFSAIDAKTKLVPCWLVGRRDETTAKAFINDLASRLAHRVQITTDGLKAYVEAVEEGFGADVDFAQLVKEYKGGSEKQQKHGKGRYSGAQKTLVTGKPDEKLVSTSFVERHNLTVRMGVRRFTRKTNAFSKKLERHCDALALFFMHYNFCRIHMTLRMTPAMAAGVTNHVWELAEIVAMLPDEQAPRNLLTPIKPRRVA